MTQAQMSHEARTNRNDTFGRLTAATLGHLWKAAMQLRKVIEKKGFWATNMVDAANRREEQLSAGIAVLDEGEVVDEESGEHTTCKVKMEEDEAGEDVYSVDHVVSHMTSKGNTSYRVRWAGCNASEDSWEPEEGLLLTKQLLDYWKRKKGPNLKRVEEAQRLALNRKSEAEAKRCPLNVDDVEKLLVTVVVLPSTQPRTQTYEERRKTVTAGPSAHAPQNNRSQPEEHKPELPGTPASACGSAPLVSPATSYSCGAHGRMSSPSATTPANHGCSSEDVAECIQKQQRAREGGGSVTSMSGQTATTCRAPDIEFLQELSVKRYVARKKRKLQATLDDSVKEGAAELQGDLNATDGTGAGMTAAAAADVAGPCLQPQVEGSESKFAGAVNQLAPGYCGEQMAPAAYVEVNKLRSIPVSCELHWKAKCEAGASGRCSRSRCEVCTLVKQKAACATCNKEEAYLPSWAHVTRAAFYSLGDNRWLQDEVVNCYIGLLAAENRQCSSDCHFFNASFYRKLAEYRSMDGSVGYSYDRVARWTKRVNLCSKRLVIIPVHRPRRKHWILVAIVMKGEQEQILSRSNT